MKNAKITIALIVVFMAILTPGIINEIPNRPVFEAILMVVLWFGWCLILLVKILQSISDMVGDNIYEVKKVEVRNIEAKLKVNTKYKQINVWFDTVAGSHDKTSHGFVELKNLFNNKTQSQDTYKSSFVGRGRTGTFVARGWYSTVKIFKNIDPGNYLLTINTGDENIHVKSVKVIGKK